MKNTFTYILLALLFASCTSTLKNEFVLTGKITGEVPEKALLQLYEEGEMKIIDSADFKKGEFKFIGQVASPDLYYIRIGDEKNLLPLFLENSTISITANIDSLWNAKIEGSAIQNEFTAFNESNIVFDTQLEALYVEYKRAENATAQMEVEIKYDSIDNLKTIHIKDYVKIHGNTLLAPYIIRRELIHTLELEELEELTNSLSPDLKENKYTKELHTRIETLKKLQPGMAAPEFTQNDINGNPINLANFKGKYVLIDFWASWCNPCRQANPTIVATFKKYSKKNFTIIGVSMDDNKEKWIEAIETDGLKWSHVSSLEGWANPVGKLYAVNSIPHAVLIDPNGNIVKRGVQANDLDALLGGLLK